MCRAVLVSFAVLLVLGCGKPTTTEPPSDPPPVVKKLTKEETAQKIADIDKEYNSYADDVGKLLKVWDKSKPADRAGLKVTIKSKLTTMKKLLDQVEDVINRADGTDPDKVKLFKLRLKDQREWLRSTEVDVGID